MTETSQALWILIFRRRIESVMGSLLLAVLNRSTFSLSSLQRFPTIAAMISHPGIERQSPIEKQLLI